MARKGHNVKTISNKPKDIPGLVIDVSELSWGESREAYLMQLRIKKASETSDAELMEKAMLGLNDLMAKVVKAIPQDFLIEDAPLTEEIDWSEPANFDLLKQDKFNVVYEQYQRMITPEGAGKN